MSTLYQVWLIPTDEGKRCLGMLLKAIGSPMLEDDASLEVYLLNCDGRVPDQDYYYSYRALPVVDA